MSNNPDLHPDPAAAEGDGGAPAPAPGRRTGTAKSTIAIRVLFLALILVLPLEFAVKKLAGGEPYPALFLPSFGGVLEQNSTVEYDQPEIVGVLTDGREVILDSRRVMPGAGGGYSVVFETIFTNQAKATAEDSKVWMRQQLRAAYPEYDFEAIYIKWLDWEFDSTNGERRIANVSQSYEIVLDGTK